MATRLLFQLLSGRSSFTLPNHCHWEKERISRLAGRAAEYMMFKDDEEDTEVPADISSTDSVIDFLDLEESKNKIQSDILSDK